jgi:hypothetical protein
VEATRTVAPAYGTCRIRLAANMSLIHTCELNGGNAFGYLNQLQLHASEVVENPDRWMPRNYRESLATLAEA